VVDCVTEIALPGRTFAAAGCATAASDDRLTMPSFVAGQENRLVAATFNRLLHAAAAVADAPPAIPNVIALVGPSGTGKTHLARGLARFWQQQRGNEAAYYTTAADFHRQFTAALSSHSLAEFRAHLRDRELLVIDDLQQLPASDHLTQELRHTLDNYEEAGGMIVITSTCPTTAIAKLPVDVRSRLAAGLQLQLAPPDAAARLRIIHHASTALGRPLSPMGARRLAAAISGQAANLFAALFELTADPASSASDDVRQTDQLLATRSRRRPTLRQIAATVAKHARLPQKELKSSSRKRSVVLARSIAIYLARELSGATYHQIGRAFGGRDHSTVMHSFRKIERERSRDPQIEESVAELRRLLVGA
jgi:chromosomal replication initiator protein